MKCESCGGGLDHLPVGQWPSLAAKWLAAGFDSESLRQLAQLQSKETRVAQALMPEALRSIGFDPAAADEEFMARCQDALAESVSATLKEVHEIAWPVCAAHGRDPTTSVWDDEPVALIDEMPWWWCTRAGHALAPVGQLTAKIARTL